MNLSQKSCPRSHDNPGTPRFWKLGSRILELGGLPVIMGIVNFTPDSFSDGGQFLDPDAAVQHALQLVDEGAGILDVGGESTRPGAAVVSPEVELARVIPIIERLAKQTDVPISIDTTKAEVARRALDAGAVIVNDISGLTFDPAMPAVCSAAEAGVVCMHMQGTPQTMQDNPHYDDVVVEIRDYFRRRLTELEQQGVRPEQVVLDPGIGFGKTAEHNLEILSSICRFRELGRPVLIGHSRKRFLSKVLGRPVEERTAGTIGVAIALAQQATDIIRVHDVRAVRDALLAWQAVANLTAGAR
jgi:dihydropteroate synthase